MPMATATKKTTRKTKIELPADPAPLAKPHLQVVRDSMPSDLYDKTRLVHELERARWLDRLTQAERQELDAAFPPVPVGGRPVGNLITLQMKRARGKVRGLIMPGTVQDAEEWNEQIGRVIAFGPLAYRQRDNVNEWWPEGPWCVIGDYIRIPKFGFDKFKVPIEGGAPDEGIVFASIQEKHVLLVLTSNPMAVKSYV